MALVAVREGVEVGTIEAVIWFIRRLDKDASVERIEEALKELDVAARAIARRELIEAGKIG